MLQASETQSTNEALLDRIERTIRWSNAFTLAFVKSNHPNQRKEISRSLIARLPDKRVLEVDLVQPLSADPLRSLFDELRSRWDAARPPDAIFVYGFEKSIGPEREFTPNILRLNNDRELFQKFFPVSLVLWLPDFALDMMPLGAPDFWAWRSGVFEFPTDDVEWHNDSLTTLFRDGDQALASWSHSEKIAQMAHLEELYRTADSLQNNDRTSLRIKAGLAGQISSLYFLTGDLSKAEHWANISSDVSSNIGDQIGLAASFHHLGVISQERGEFQKAIDYYQDSLKLSEMSGNDAGFAVTLSQLGWAHRDLSDIELAVDFFNKSMDIDRRLNNQKGEINNLHGIVAIELGRGNVKQAESLLHQLLEIEQRIGAKSSMAVSFHQLGAVKANEGDFLSAKILYEQSLQIDQELGNKRGEAGSSYALAMVEEIGGDVRQAEDYLVRAVSLSRDIWPEMHKGAIKVLERLRTIVGEEQFRQRMQVDFPREAKQILLELDDVVTTNESFSLAS